MNIKELIQSTLKRTKLPSLEIEIILAHILKKSKEYLFAHPEKQLTKSCVMRYALCVTRRIKGEPIAYITGHKQFYGLDFHVNKNVLVPRPETELMVDEALRITRNVERVTLIDVGTGSGCIIITLAKLLKNKIRYLATDISKPALLTARKNAKQHYVHKKIKFLHGNLLEPILKLTKKPNYPLRRSYSEASKLQITNYIILANLPYLTPNQIKNSPTIQNEPKLALTAGSDGLKYYRQLFKQIKRLQIEDCPGRDTRSWAGRFTILCEINPSQTAKIKQLAKRELPCCKILIKKDLRGHNRLAIISTQLSCPDSIAGS